MMQLQFELQKRNEARGLKEGEKRWIVGGLEGSKDAEEREGPEKAVQEDWLAEAVLASDALSFADAKVSRRIETRIEVCFFFSYNDPFFLDADSSLSQITGSRFRRLYFLGRPRNRTSYSLSSCTSFSLNSTPLSRTRTRNRIFYRIVSVFNLPKSNPFLKQ